MNIVNTPGVQAATQAASSATADSVNMLVLKKALDSQAITAATLLQALPQPAPALATSGSVGTQVNTFA